MLLTPTGILTEVSLPHIKKAASPTAVKPSGNDTLVKLLQLYQNISNYSL
jgi:hypothetical protein